MVVCKLVINAYSAWIRHINRIHDLLDKKQSKTYLNAREELELNNRLESARYIVNALCISLNKPEDQIRAMLQAEYMAYLASANDNGESSYHH